MKHRIAHDWFYIKLYTPAIFFNVLLLEHIKPLIQRLQQNGIIQTWFFVRYLDFKPHIRLRCLPTIGNAERLTAELQSAIGNLITDQLIERWAVEPYEPEVERYGGCSSLREWHQLFEVSSKSILKDGIGPLGPTGDLENFIILGNQIRLLASSFLLSWIDDIRPALRSTPISWVQRCKNLELAFGAPVTPILESTPPLSRLSELDLSGKLSKPLKLIIPSFTHMHMNRLGLTDTAEIDATAALYRSLRSSHIRALNSRP